MRCAESNCRNYFNAIRFAFAFGLFAGTISIGNENKEIAYTAFKCSPESTQHTHTYKSLNYINTNVRQSAQMNNKPNESLLKKNQLEMNNKTNNNKIYRKVNSKTRKQLK